MGQSHRVEETEQRKERLAALERKLKIARANEPQYLTCEFIVSEARQLKLWMYDPQIKRWFTPDEFHTYYHAFPKEDKIFQRVQLRDPFDAIEAAHQQVENISHRLLLFTRKLLTYTGK